MLSETWKEIYKCYEVSSEGRVRRKLVGCSTYKGKIHKQYINTSGYPYVTFSVNGKVFSKLVHPLVAEAFLEPKPLDKEVNHIDGNKQNNKVTNLEYITRSENQYHALEKGLYTSAKIHMKQVRAIRQQYSTGKLNQPELAKKYNVCPSTISNIVNRRSWGWL